MCYSIISHARDKILCLTENGREDVWILVTLQVAAGPGTGIIEVIVAVPTHVLPLDSVLNRTFLCKRG